jgi:hypothetical protein
MGLPSVGLRQPDNSRVSSRNQDIRHVVRLEYIACLKRWDMQAHVPHRRTPGMRVLVALDARLLEPHSSYTSAQPDQG